MSGDRFSTRVLILTCFAALLMLATSFAVVATTSSSTDPAQSSLAPAMSHLETRGLDTVETASSKTHTVTFDETGLESGTSWSVTLNGKTVNSTGYSIKFSESPGTYEFSLLNVGNFSAWMNTSTVQVGDAAVLIDVRFVPTQSNVMFLLPVCVVGLKAAVNGGVYSPYNAPGGILIWNWGDGSKLIDQDFPASHTYKSGGAYLLTASQDYTNGSVSSVSETAQVGAGLTSGCVEGTVIAPAHGSINYAYWLQSSGKISASSSKEFTECVGCGVTVTAVAAAHYAFENWTVLSGSSDFFGNASSQSTYAVFWVDGSVTVTFVRAFSVSAVATPAFSSINPQVPLSVSFSGSAVGGTAPYSYLWSFGDGQTSTAQDPVHDYTQIGDFLATLTVTDAAGVAVTAAGVPVNVSVPTGVNDVVTAHKTSYTDGGGNCDVGYPNFLSLKKCYTIQQNLFLSNSSDPSQAEYWVQNVIVNGTESGASSAYAVEEIWPLSNDAIECSMCFSVRNYSLMAPSDGVFDLTTVVAGDSLIVNDSWDGYTWGAPAFYLPSGSVSYVVDPVSLCDLSFVAPPELQIVGPPGGGEANFTAGTGSATSSIEFEPGNLWLSNLSKSPVDPVSTGCHPYDQTEELANNLTWSAPSGSVASPFKHSSGAFDQGFGFVGVPTQATVAGVTTNYTLSNSVYLNQSFATRVDLSVNNTTEPQGAAVSLLGEVWNGDPTGILSPGLPSSAFFEVQVTGLSNGVGNADACIAVASSSTANVVEYWNGANWVALTVTRTANQLCVTLPVWTISQATPTVFVVGAPERRTSPLRAKGAKTPDPRRESFAED